MCCVASKVLKMLHFVCCLKWPAKFLFHWLQLLQFCTFAKSKRFIFIYQLNHYGVDASQFGFHFWLKSNIIKAGSLRTLLYLV